MSSTKIINVLKDDKFDELLDLVKDSTASEVIFVLPKTTRAFKTEEHFAVLEQEAKKGSKSITFLCSNPEVNGLAQKYNFDVLSAKEEKPEKKKLPILSASQKQNRGSSISQPRQGGGEIGTIAVPVAAKNDDPIRGKSRLGGTADHALRAGRTSNGMDEEDEEATHDEFDEHRSPFGKEPEEPEEEIPAEEEEEYKEEEEKEPEVVEDEPPYGTELDESGNPIYDEEEPGEGPRLGGVSVENIAEQISSEIITAAAKTKEGVGKNIKIIQKDGRPIKIDTQIRKREDDIRSVFSRGTLPVESSDNIWSDISKPTAGRLFGKAPFLNKFKLFKKQKGGLEFGTKNFQPIGLKLLSLISILVLAFIIYLTTGSAKVEIKPKAEKLNIQLKVSVSPNFPSVDSSLNRIPGQLFTINKTAADEFNATGEKDAIQKSRGVITIYNEYSTSPQVLVATTRFEFVSLNKESGLIFRTLKTVTVPGMKVENSTVTPGKIDVEVIADKAGQAYNVQAGDFGIVAWREKGDTARYEKIYGRSSESMHGGILGKAKVVSEFDYNNARDQLTVKVKSEIGESLKSQSAGLELLTTIESKIDSVESTAEIDDAADTFTVTVKGSIVTIGFKKDDLTALISQYIDKTKSLAAVPEKLELSYKNVVINPANNILEVVVGINGNAYAKIDKEEIADNLMGKRETQIKDYLGSIKDIDSAKVILSPFWVKKIPKNKEKIDILLTF